MQNFKILTYRERNLWWIAYVRMCLLILQMCLVRVPAFAQLQGICAPNNPVDNRANFSITSPGIRFTSIPFSAWERNGNPVIKVKINGVLDANFIVDTGSDMTVVRPSVVRSLGISPFHRDAYEPTSGKHESIDCVNVDKIDIGGGLICSGYADVSDSIPAPPFAKKIDGILGGNMLFQRAVEFDFETNTMLICESGNLTQNQLDSLRFFTDKSLVVSAIDDPAQYTVMKIPVSVQGLNGRVQKQTLEVDTGGSITQVPSGIAILNSKPLTSYLIGPVGGPVTVDAFAVQCFRVGDDATLADRFCLSPFACVFLPAEPTVADLAILSIDYLSHFRVLLDYPAHKLYLTPVTNDAKILFPTQISRINGTRQQDDIAVSPSLTGQWTVTKLETSGNNVFHRSGLQVGDTFVSIDGVRTDGTTPSFMRAMLSRVERGPLVLNLVRNDNQLNLTINY